MLKRGAAPLTQEVPGGLNTNVSGLILQFGLLANDQYCLLVEQLFHPNLLHMCSEEPNENTLWQRKYVDLDT